MASSTNAPLGEHIIDIIDELKRAKRVCDEIKKRHLASSLAVGELSNLFEKGKSKVKRLKESVESVTGQNVGVDHADNTLRADIRHCAHNTRRLRSSLEEYEKLHRPRKVSGFLCVRSPKVPPVHGSRLRAFGDEWLCIQKDVMTAFAEFNYRVGERAAYKEDIDAKVKDVENKVAKATEKEKERADNLQVELDEVYKEREMRRKEQEKRNEDIQKVIHEAARDELKEGPVGVVKTVAGVAKEIKEVNRALRPEHNERDPIEDFKKVGKVAGELMVNFGGKNRQSNHNPTEDVKTLGGVAANLLHAADSHNRSHDGSNIAIATSSYNGIGHCCSKCSTKILHARVKAGGRSSNNSVEEFVGDSASGRAHHGETHQIELPALENTISRRSSRTNSSTSVDKLDWHDNKLHLIHHHIRDENCRHHGADGECHWHRGVDTQHPIVERVDHRDGVFFPFTKKLPHG